MYKVLLASVAVRGEKYSDFGSSVAGTPWVVLGQNPSLRPLMWIW